MTRTVQLYLVITSIGLLGIFAILRMGNELRSTTAAAPVAATIADRPATPADSDATFLSAATANLFHNGTSGLSRLFLQLFVIIAATSLAGTLFTKLGQPAVVGEMITGVLLGPSLFGLVAPHAFAFLFAPFTLEPLRLFSQIGVCLFMFAV